MIIFTKDKDGWQKSGSILPTERFYRIAQDALDPEPKPLPCDMAIQEVERRIAAGTEAFRFELASPPASFFKAAREQSDKRIRKILLHTVAKRRALKKRSETGKQRRARLIREHKCTACGKRRPRKGRRECGPCARYYAIWAQKAKKAAK